MKRVSTGIAFAGVFVALLGFGSLAVYSTTPAVLLTRPGPHGDRTQPIQSLPALFGGGWLNFDSPPPPSPWSSASQAPAAKRTGLWIEAPELQIALPIKPGDGSNHFAYWTAFVYPGTATPGAPGNSFIYAHGYLQMFGGLLYARSGDSIQLHDYSAGTIRTFRVSHVVGRVRFNDVSWISTPSRGPMLTLQTCIDTNPQGDRYIVQAVPG